jgi:hypothetical protein
VVVVKHALLAMALASLAARVEAQSVEGSTLMRCVSVRFVAQTVRTWKAEHGPPTTTVVYAIAVDDVRRPCSVTLTIQGTTTRDANVRFQEMLSIVVPRRVTHLTGYRDIDASATPASVTVTTDDPRDRKHAQFRSLDVSAQDSMPLMLSDVVVGAESQRLALVHSADSIWLAPLGVINRSEPAELYYQVRSDSTVSDVRTIVRVTRVAGDNGIVEEALHLGFDDQLRPGLNERHKTLDLSSLEGGQYRIDLSIAAGDGRLIRTRSSTIHLASGLPALCEVNRQGSSISSGQCR